MRQKLGVAWMTWGACSPRKSWKVYGSKRTSAGTASTDAPTVSGSSISAMEMSKDRAVAATIVSPATSPGVDASPARRSSRDVCETMTPFGRPVEPEVYMT